MNCQEFDQILNELAGPKSEDATLRERGLAHSAACQLCAVRLANARALVDGLKALASTTENSAASFQTEELLLAAFRQHQATMASPIKTNVIKMPAKKNRQVRIPLWAYAAAAAVLIAVGGFAASMLLKTPPPREITLAPSPSPSKEVKQQDTAQSEPKSLPSDQTGKLASNQPKGRKRQKPVNDGSYVQSSLGEFTPVYGEEIATDFLSLTHEIDSQPMESGQLIRVQMPRTALASFGLPINIERANETVKADLLLAEDGSARAIRFIR